MTPSSDPAAPATDLASSVRPYLAPEMAPLGSIEAITAGPDKSPDKHLDMLIGSDGGFFRDTTS